MQERTLEERAAMLDHAANMTDEEALAFFTQGMNRQQRRAYARTVEKIKATRLKREAQRAKRSVRVPREPGA